MTAEASEGRSLGYSETLLHLLHHASGLIVLQVLHVRGTVDEQGIRQALATIQARHPILQCHIRLGGMRTIPQAPFVTPKFVFERKGTTAIPVNTSAIDWREVLSNELNRPIRGRKVPRLRVTLVRDGTDPNLCHIVLCADHATIDAKSVNMISRELLELLGGGDSSPVEPVSEAALPPALEERLPKKSRNPSTRYQRSIALPAQRIRGLIHPTRLIDRRLDRQASADLQNVIRANRTSLHGALAAAFMLAERDKFGIDDVTMLTTVDLRRFCRPPIPPDVFGCFIDILRTRHVVKPDLWELARDVSFGVINTLAKNQEGASILRFWGPEFYFREVPAMISNGRRVDALAITTAGESGLQRDYGALTLDGVSMAVSMSLFGPAIFVIASERDGGIDLSIGYSTGGLRTADAEDLADRALNILGAAQSHAVTA